MKNINLVLAVFGIFSGVAALAGPVLVSELPTQVFTPVGFDSNDNAQVVLDGYFPSTCYKVAPLETSVDQINHKIYVNNQASYFSGSFCLMMVVPYTRVVDLGTLVPGDYEVLVRNNSQTYMPMNQLKVNMATNLNPDDHLYAPVSEAYAEKNGSKVSLTLKGTFANTCIKMTEIKVMYTAGNTIEVLPITQIADPATCATGAALKPFSVHTTLNPPNKGRYLVHVRSLNGQAINKVVTF